MDDVGLRKKKEKGEERRKKRKEEKKEGKREERKEKEKEYEGTAIATAKTIPRLRPVPFVPEPVESVLMSLISGERIGRDQWVPRGEEPQLGVSDSSDARIRRNVDAFPGRMRCR
ncbi:hypothetical protein SODALDRAFT_139374 [Sodiomyces alkalinus F11]|uniref:Uncharacterized protein n=1 Tax=Sodiomyces alkalinus (strain CBS 110278 / VKM F-3762 / F11) TaxID=1314773 RepID=A0A3N2PZE0_SODAK|nr:hypothetical protein SODALDRAFT_139374 [Sodiomyces alkalinus F11]ROT39852.1 hypothetical protein SODALDRAFT_139374 [Sodiomyces alkalinus F11]